MTEKEKLESSPYNTLKSEEAGQRSSNKSSTHSKVCSTHKSSASSKQREGSRSFLVPELVVDCGLALGVKLDGGDASQEEHCLLCVAYAALTAEVKKPWEERADAKGRRYLYNCRTGLRAKYHPLEKVYAKCVQDLRQQNFVDKNKQRVWMKVKDPETQGEYWYNCKTKERKELDASIAESNEIKASVVPEGLLPEFPVQQATPANTAELVQSVKLLSFKSWWYEDSEEPTLGNGSSAGSGLKKRYVRLEYDLEAKTFRIILEENVAIDLSDVQSKRKLPIECWDLHIGATLDILGKNTTLQQGTFETIQWLDYKAARLLAVKKDLLQVLQKYRTASVPAAWSFALNNKPGCCSLRKLMRQIEELKEELGKFRPSLSKTFTIEDVLET
ncbi:hypothetical protein HOP50_17g79210 [Chloropicon primus]|uniref:WW domain-containing protein n=1 Tax=Chloropicon primus TaxID=1764295 RepID=A0A5B8MYA4_9CHLO|nr:hypothetical protein A3770_17p78990 [Chloropicon primus]UPR04579.1 hypothetical protein HOP50_17g79210 [Chloropicon primus]|eukprot:QDZ25381.1 hypothetical protein A3770_17p78990 [Chloropicon primus]